MRRRQVKIHRHRSASVVGPLDLGVRWARGRSYPSLLAMWPDAKIVVRDRFRVVSGFQITIREGATWTTGHGFANTGFLLDVTTSLEMGDDVIIGEQVAIRDSDAHDLDGAAGPAPVRIGSHVWIGLRATILKGVTIGDGAVVAAGALVTSDVPARTLVGGVPAKVLREEVEWRP
jgi:acetyltransferase-like isoleucine patch superfamily enzyme